MRGVTKSFKSVLCSSLKNIFPMKYCPLKFGSNFWRPLHHRRKLFLMFCYRRGLLQNLLYFDKIWLIFLVLVVFPRFLMKTNLCSKIYLRNGASEAKNYFINLLLKFNFKEILFYTSSLKNASFYDFLLNFQIFEF